MAIDPFSLCPGGTGKKIKFCCPDLVGELQQIDRMLHGQQRAACLEYIKSLETKYPERACLLSTKAMLQTALGKPDEAAQTVGAYQSKYPDNPIALAEQALTLVSKPQMAVEAVGVLQRALELCQGQLMAQVVQATAAVGQALLMEGHVAAARAHLALVATLRPKDERLTSLVVQVAASPSVPLLLRQDPFLVPCPAGSLWKSAFDSAIHLADLAAWRAAADKLSELPAKVGDWPPIWKNIAILRMWVADEARAGVALRKYAEQDVPHDEAVEAEALAQQLESRQDGDRIDLVTVSFRLPDAERVQESLASDPRTPRLPVNVSMLASDDQPPPRAVYALLDRPQLRHTAAVTLAEAPRVLGQMLLYGKQTDRDARLELSAAREPDLPAAKAALVQVLGDALGESGPENPHATVPAPAHLLGWNLYLPAEVKPDQRAVLAAEHRHEALLEKWPQLRQRALGGRTPREAAAEPSCRLALEAAVLTLELADDRVEAEADFAELRRQLGLPLHATIDPTAVNLDELPISRFARIDVAKLSDEALLGAVQLASYYRFVPALRKLAEEIARRPALDDRLDKAGMFGVLASVETNSARALEYVNRARSVAETRKESCAAWDLEELQIRLERLEIDEVNRVLNHVREAHVREPGVAQALMQILVEAGAMNPDGTPTAVPAQVMPAAAVPGAAAVEPGKLWTPGSQPAASAGKKPAIWTPGMD